MIGKPSRSEWAARRAVLVQRSRALRAGLVADAQALRPVFTAADAVRDGVHWLREHPLWLAGAVGLMALRRPRRALRWVWRWGPRLWAMRGAWQRWLRG
jgi:hypothetical protein